MKKYIDYLKLCNDPFQESSRKFEKSAIVATIISTIIIAIIGLIIAF